MWIEVYGVLCLFQILLWYCCLFMLFLLVPAKCMFSLIFAFNLLACTLCCAVSCNGIGNHVASDIRFQFCLCLEIFLKYLTSNTNIGRWFQSAVNHFSVKRYSSMMKTEFNKICVFQFLFVFVCLVQTFLWLQFLIYSNECINDLIPVKYNVHPIWICTSYDVAVIS